jgi:PPP family 3-phenylpropionic acid transporter
MMMPVSVAYVGLALWLADHGIGPQRIGLINALPLVVVVVLSVSVGRLADRASDLARRHRRVLHGRGGRGRGLVLCPLLLGDRHSLDAHDGALAAHDSGRRRRDRAHGRIGVPYGAIRVWGTVGYIVVAILTGSVMQAFGDGLFVGLLVAVSALRFGIALLLPQLRAPEKPAASEAIAPPNRSAAAELKHCCDLGSWPLCSRALYSAPATPC